MIARMLLIPVMACSVADASVRSGRAAVEWIAVSPTCEPGRPAQTAIRMVHDEGWHSYWLNPGEAGVPTTVEWKLPPGWQCGGIRHPAPVRFLTGELVGYGYEGTVLFPVTLTPPADFTGKVRLEAVVKWLACSGDGCVPGEARLVLELAAGPTQPGPEAAAFQAAWDAIPQPAREALRLEVVDQGKSLALVIRAHDEALDLDRHEVFPALPDVIDPRAVIRFSKAGGTWTAEAPKSEYSKEPVKHLTLVLAGGGARTPLELTWNAP